MEDKILRSVTKALSAAMLVFCTYVLVRFTVYTGNRIDMNFVLPFAGFCAVVLGCVYVLGRWNLAERLNWLKWWHIALLGMALRLAWALVVQPMPISDHLNNLVSIRQVMATGEYPFYSGYPVTMVYYAALLKVFDSQLVVWVMNSLLAGLQVGCVWLIATRLTGQRLAAQCAALAWAVYPAMVTYASVMSSESPSITLMLLVSVGLIEVLRGGLGRPKLLFAGIGLGILFGLTFFSRTTSLLLLPALGLLLLLQREIKREQIMPMASKVLLGACLLFGFGASLVPQTLWHWQTYGTPSFTTNSQAGLVFWYGTSRESNGRWNKEWQVSMIAEIAEDGYIWPDTAAKKEASRRAKARAMDNILKDPVDFLVFALTDKFDQMWANDNVLASTWEASERFKGKHGAPYAALSAVLNVGYITLWLLALCGCVYGLVRGVGGLAFVNLFVLTFFGFHLLFEVQPRYHLILMPFVCILSGSGLSFLLERFSRQGSTAAASE